MGGGNLTGLMRINPNKVLMPLPRYIKSPPQAGDFNQDNNTKPPMALLRANLSCVDFYNQSDDKILWWQALQREISVKTNGITLYAAPKTPCPDEHHIDFYLKDKPGSSIKYVDCQRGMRLRSNMARRFDSVGVCYHPTQRPLSSLDHLNVAEAFVYCLFHYGKGV